MSTTEVEVQTARPYRVRIGPGVLQGLPQAVAGASRLALLTDANVWRHQAPSAGAWAHARLVVEPGEGSKSFTTLERVLDFFSEEDLERSSLLVAFGGGVVGDLGGLAAALYMRGIDFVQCPTTLLAQVDSSVGGKTAVNLTRGKNLAGSFHQPRAVLADTETLTTLPPEEFLSGLGEVVKSALLGDGELLGLLESEQAAIGARDAVVLTAVVEHCVRLKAAIVARDERESGERKKLNLGHTFAHAIEWAAGFGRIPHGIAVATGLALALETSARAGLLGDAELPGRVRRLLEALGLFPGLPELRRHYGTQLAAGTLREGMRHDKKGGAGTPRLVLLGALGDARIDQTAQEELLAGILA